MSYSIPLRLLTDQGPQANEIIGRAFAGDRVQTIAYHPEINGRIEHMHATLESMLAKCRKRGIDWVEQ